MQNDPFLFRFTLRCSRRRRSTAPHAAQPNLAGPCSDAPGTSPIAKIAPQAACNNQQKQPNNRPDKLNDQPNQPCGPQNDHRAPHRDDDQGTKRSQVLLSGELIYADAQARTLTCLVLELFPGGVRIETDQAAAIPEYLFFRLGAAPLRPVCRRLRQGNRVELRYLEPLEAAT